MHPFAGYVEYPIPEFKCYEVNLEEEHEPEMTYQCRSFQLRSFVLYGSRYMNSHLG